MKKVFSMLFIKRAFLCFHLTIASLRAHLIPLTWFDLLKVRGFGRGGCHRALAVLHNWCSILPFMDCSDCAPDKARLSNIHRMILKREKWFCRSGDYTASEPGVWFQHSQHNARCLHWSFTPNNRSVLCVHWSDHEANWSRDWQGQ